MGSSVRKDGYTFPNDSLNIPSILQAEQVLDGTFKNLCQFQPQFQGGEILIVFNGIDGLAGDLELVRQVFLCHIMGNPVYFDGVFHDQEA